jgi:hypothetical protein
MSWGSDWNNIKKWAGKYLVPHYVGGSVPAAQDPYNTGKKAASTLKKASTAKNSSTKSSSSKSKTSSNPSSNWDMGTQVKNFYGVVNAKKPTIKPTVTGQPALHQNDPIVDNSQITSGDGGGDMSGYFNNGQSFDYNGQTYDPTASGFDLNSILNLSDAELADLRKTADETAKSQGDQQRTALDSLLKQALDTYTSNQNTINNQKTDAQQSLEQQSFQDYLKSRQSIADRGLASSGLADDANTRLMLNRNQALAGLMKEADSKLLDAKNTYDTSANDLNNQKANVNDKATSDSLYQQLKSAAEAAKQEQAKMMMEWNKWITPSGDTAYKAQSDQIIANANNQIKYQIAQMNNDTKLQINENSNATDIAIAGQKLQMQMAQLNASVWNNGQKQALAAGNQQYSVMQQILSALAKDPSNKALKKQYNDALNNWQSTVSNALGNTTYTPSYSSLGFNSGSGGGGTATKGTAAYQANLAAANKRGLPTAWNGVLSEIVKRESGFNPNAKNPKSTAYGYGQFLASTRANYEKKMGMSYSDPVNQLIMMAQYIKDRYGSPKNALAFWNKNHWY